MNLAPLLDADKIQQLEQFGETAWELVGVIEESFDIVFTADDLIAANTVGKLSECISQKLQGQPTDRCISALVFYRLRRASVESLSLLRSQIRPGTRLDELFPWTTRMGQWEALRQQSGFILPTLTYPGWLVGILLLTSTASAWVFADWFWKIPITGLATVVFWIFSFVFLMRLTRPIARAFPRSCSIVADLVRITIARNHARLAGQFGGTSPREMFSVLRQLVAIETGCNSKEISEQTAFPGGLKID